MELILLFWHDTWKGDNHLAIYFHRVFALDYQRITNVRDCFLIGWNTDEIRCMPRGGIEQVQWESFLEMMQDVQLKQVLDRLGWSLDISDTFTFLSARYALDNRVVTSEDMLTRWNNWVPNKLNIIIWRVQLSSIPLRERLSNRGILVHSIMCPIYTCAVETIGHIFTGCSELIDIWVIISIWWGLSLSDQLSLQSLINWSDGVNLWRGQQKVFDTVIIISFWCIRNFRNISIFGTVLPK